MDVKERIQKYIDYKGINVFSFEKTIGCSNGYWRKTKSISANILSDIARIYSDLSINWVVTGEGDMLSSESLNALGYTESEMVMLMRDTKHKPETLSQTKTLLMNTRNTIKYYPSVSGSMGGIEFLDDPDEFSTDIVLPGFSECKFAINAYGDSMYPVIKSGQIVIMMAWTERFIDWGHIYMVVTKSGYRAIKYLKPSMQEGFITCESENKANNPAFEIEMEDIHRLYLVKGWICKDAI